MPFSAVACSNAHVLIVLLSIQFPLPNSFYLWRNSYWSLVYCCFSPCLYLLKCSDSRHQREVLVIGLQFQHAMMHKLYIPTKASAHLCFDFFLFVVRFLMSWIDYYSVKMFCTHYKYAHCDHCAHFATMLNILVFAKGKEGKHKNCATHFTTHYIPSMHVWLLAFKWI